MAALHPVGHVDQPEDVAHSVAFLLSPEAALITGTVLPVDGGRAALGPDPQSTQGQAVPNSMPKPIVSSVRSYPEAGG